MRLYILLGLLSFLCSIFAAQRFQLSPLEVSPQESKANFQTHFYSLFSLGNKRLISSYLWIQTLLDSDLEHYSQKDLNNWMFTRFKTIIMLEPNFIEAYRYGGIYLSVIKDDDMGAEFIFNKGLELFSEDYILNYYGGFHYYHELNMPEKAVKLFQRIMFNPQAPKNLPSIVAKLRQNSGDPETAYTILVDAISRISDDNSFFKKHFSESLKSLRIEIDLKCLNQIKKNCNTQPPPGYFYIKGGDGIYHTNKPYSKIKLYKH